MPNVWAGTTLDGVQCRLNSEPAGLVAHVGKGGKKAARAAAGSAGGCGGEEGC